MEGLGRGHRGGTGVSPTTLQCPAPRYAASNKYLEVLTLQVMYSTVLYGTILWIEKVLGGVALSVPSTSCRPWGLLACKVAETPTPSAIETMSSLCPSHFIPFQKKKKKKIERKRKVLFSLCLQVLSNPDFSARLAAHELLRSLVGGAQGMPSVGSDSDTVTKREEGPASWVVLTEAQCSLLLSSLWHEIIDSTGGYAAGTGAGAAAAAGAKAGEGGLHCLPQPLVLP